MQAAALDLKLTSERGVACASTLVLCNGLSLSWCRSKEMLAVAVCTIAESLQHHFASVLVRVTHS